jgi:hypothetical protein
VILATIIIAAITVVVKNVLGGRFLKTNVAVINAIMIWEQ